MKFAILKTIISFLSAEETFEGTKAVGKLATGGLVCILITSVFSS